MGGRGVIGLLLIAAGIWLLYGVITGRTLGTAPTFANSTPGTTNGPANTNQGISAAPGFGSPNASKRAQYVGSGPDVTASNGGMTDFTGGIPIAQPGGLPTMHNLYGTSKGVFV